MVRTWPMMPEPNATDIRRAIAVLRRHWIADRNRVRNEVEKRGVDIHTTMCRPPSDDELRADFWWSEGMLCALDELCDELELTT